MKKMLKNVISCGIGATVGCVTTNVASNKMMTIANQGLVFKKKGIIFNHYTDLNGKKVSKKMVPYKRVVSGSKEETKSLINKVSASVGTTTGITTGLMTYKYLGKNEEKKPSNTKIPNQQLIAE